MRELSSESTLAQNDIVRSRPALPSCRTAFGCLTSPTDASRSVCARAAHLGLHVRPASRQTNCLRQPSSQLSNLSAYTTSVRLSCFQARRRASKHGRRASRGYSTERADNAVMRTPGLQGITSCDKVRKCISSVCFLSAQDVCRILRNVRISTRIVR